MGTTAFQITSLTIVYSAGCRSKKTSKLRVTGLCAGNSPGTSEFPAQMASNAENVSIWWRHNGKERPCSHVHHRNDRCQRVLSKYKNIIENPPGVGVTKAPFANFSVSTIFEFAKVPVRFPESHSYLTGVTAAELRQHLPNINVIFNS